MYDATPTIDRVLRARPRDFTPERIEEARGWLLGYRRKLGNAPTCHAPEDNIVAQFLAVADWPDLERMLYQLFQQRIPPGDKDAWFITVALNRIHSIAPAVIQKRRAQLKLVRAASAEASADNVQQFAKQLTANLTAKIGGLQ